MPTVHLLLRLALLALLAGQLVAADPPVRQGQVAPDRLDALIAEITAEPFQPHRPLAGLTVVEVLPDSQASRIGLQVDDLIVGIDAAVIGRYADSEFFNDFRRDGPQTLHWQRLDGSRHEAAIEAGRLGVDLRRTYYNQALAGIDTPTPDPACRLAAETAFTDPRLAEAALARALEAHPPPSARTVALIWHAICFGARRYQDCIDQLLREYPPEDEAHWQRNSPLGFHAAYRLARPDLVARLAERWPTVYLAEETRRAMQRIGSTPDPRPLSERADRFLPRRDAWRREPTSFERFNDDLWSDGRILLDTGTDRYTRATLEVPAEDLAPATGIRLAFDALIETFHTGKAKYPPMLWLQIAPQGRATEVYWNLFGPSAEPGSHTKIAAPGLLPLETWLPERHHGSRPRWHHLECWLHDRRMECHVDGALAQVIPLRRPMSGPRFLFHLQSSKIHIRNLQIYQFDITEEAADR